MSKLLQHCFICTKCTPSRPCFFIYVEGKRLGEDHGLEKVKHVTTCSGGIPTWLHEYTAPYLGDT